MKEKKTKVYAWVENGVVTQITELSDIHQVTFSEMLRRVLRNGLSSFTKK